MAGKWFVAGGATLSMTLILLLLMAALLGFSAQQQVREWRIQSSEFRQREALAQAEANLAQAISLLMRYREAAPALALWPDLVSVESHALPPLGSEGWMWQLSAHGGGQEAHVGVQRQLLATPLLLRRPITGLLLPGAEHAGDRLDLLDYLFGMPTSSQTITELRSLASQNVTDCRSLNSQTPGLILVHGTCQLRGQVGSLTQPVLLVLTSGELHLASDASFYGLMLLLGDEDASAVQWAAGGRLYGALVSQRPLPELKPGVIEYSPELLTLLQRSPALWRFDLVAGSWRDW